MHTQEGICTSAIVLCCHNIYRNVTGEYGEVKCWNLTNYCLLENCVLDTYILL